MEIEPPTQSLPVNELDPVAMSIPAQHLRNVADHCLTLPETQQGEKFGAPCFKAGGGDFARFTSAVAG